MEGAHGQLGTRFTDGLSGNHADCFTTIDQTATAQIAAMTTAQVAGLETADLASLKTSSLAAMTADVTSALQRRFGP